jgi:hypothetical protein
MRPDVTMPAATYGEAAARGIARHLDFEAWLGGLFTYRPESEWPDQEGARLRFLLEVSTRLSLDVPWHCEIVLVYDVLTERTRISTHKRTHEDPEARPSELRLIADLAQEHLIVDWKTGRPIDGASKQTRALALAWARLRGLSDVSAALAYVSDGGGIWWKAEVLDAFDLADVAEELRQLYVHEADHKARPGPWCRELYCPLVGTCPATAPALVQASGGLVPSLDPQTPEEATALYLAREAVRGWDRDAHAALRRYVDAGHTIEIGNGRQWGKVETRGSERVTLTAEGIAYLREALPSCLEVSTSKTAINGAAPKAQAKAVLSRLGELGCLATKSAIKYEEIGLAIGVRV